MMVSGPEVPRHGLVVDASAAMAGGGPARTRELLHTLPVLAPQHQYVFFVPRQLAREARPSTTARVVTAPYLSLFPPARALWQHLVLPHKLSRLQPTWVLSPFNVLPLGPGTGQTIGRALIVSNISPFAPEIWRDLGALQRARLIALRSLTLASLRRADVVFLLSHLAEGLLHRELTHRRVVFLPMAPPGPAALEAADHQRIPPHVADRPFFLAVGDLVPYKGVEDAVAAMRLAIDDGIDARLLVCGFPLHSGYASRLRSIARDSHGRILFLGRTTHALSLALMKRATATVVTSRIENVSRVPIEAMSVGCPVLAADVPASREACGDAALYYPAGDPRMLASLMSEAMDSDVRTSASVRCAAHLDDVDWMSASRAILRALDLL
jgi:glycosyltransferase involved in cell wall biosynthesis